MVKLLICISALLVGTLSIPVKDALMFEGPDDTATVESTVREARAAPKHIGDLLKPANGDDGEGDESRKAYSVFEELNEDDKKQPKKKVEAEFNYYGGEGGSEGGGESEEGEGGGSYYSSGGNRKSKAESGDGEGAESSESSEGDGGEAENEEYEESSEEGDGEEEDDY